MRSYNLVFAALMGVLLLFGGVLLAQDAKKGQDQDAKKVQERLRGQLPAGYGKLGLSDDQRQRIYKIQSAYDTKIGALEEQLRKLRADQKREIDSVLTADQLKLMRKILEEKLPGGAGK
jgi:hypothetical protein